jgi:hypothetical protein
MTFRNGPKSYSFRLGAHERRHRQGFGFGVRIANHLITPVSASSAGVPGRGRQCQSLTTPSVPRVTGSQRLPGPRRGPSPSVTATAPDHASAADFTGLGHGRRVSVFQDSTGPRPERTPHPHAQRPCGGSSRTRPAALRGSVGTWASQRNAGGTLAGVAARARRTLVVRAHAGRRLSGSAVLPWAWGGGSDPVPGW